MGSFDIFYDAADRSTITHTRSTTSNTSGATWLYPEGAAFTLASSPGTPFTEGQKVFLHDGAAGWVFCIVKKVTDATHLTLLPLQTALDSVGLPYQFPNGSSLTIMEETGAQQVIDLSEAPDDSYDYVVMGSGTIEDSASPGQVDISMRLMALQDDPFSGTGGSNAAKVTLTAANPDRMNYFGAAKVTLAGGQRYENFLNFNGPSTAGVVTSLNNPRLLALRVTGGYFGGDGKTATQNTTSTSYADVSGLVLPANIPAGQYLIVASWALGSTAAGAYSDCVLEADGSTVLANHVSSAPATSDFIPAGFFGVVTLGATNQVRLRLKSVAGSNANIRNCFLAAIPIASIPALAAAHVSQDLSTDYSASVGASFTSVKTSGSVTLQSGRHIEIVSASVGGAAAFRSRPVYRVGASDEQTGLGNDNLPPFGSNGTGYHPTVWFVRNRRTAGTTTNAVQMRSQSGSNTLKARDFTFSWLREQPDFVAQPNDEIAIIADIELGGRVLKHWNATTTTRRYSHRIDDQRAFSRVRVNGQEYTRVYSTAALTDAGTWFWDPIAMDLYVQITVAHAGLGAPESSSLNIVVVPLLLAGLETYHLTDARGVRWPYRPLIKSAPRMTQKIESDSAKFSASASLGSLTLAMAHGEFDDQLFRSYFDSYRVKIRRGYLRKSSRIDDFEVVADAVIRDVSSDFETLTLQLLDRRRVMQTPVAKTQITVCEGFAADARTRADQDLPVRWGETLGQVAYRITSVESTSGWNEYRFVDHAVKSVLKVWLDAERRTSVAATNPPLDTSATYTGVGKIRLNNSVWPVSGGLAQPGDVVYVDFIGRTSTGLTTGTALQKVGEIARDMLVTDGGTPAARLQERTFRMIDRRWRWQQIAGGGRRPAGPRVSFGISGKTTLQEALTELCGNTVTYWNVNHQDRIGLDVPDFDRGNLARNGGFEDDSASLFPWKTLNGATLAITTSRKYAGARSAEISNGSPVDTNAAAIQQIVLAAGGTHVVTLVASLLEGTPSSFRIGMVGPSGIETLSDPQTVGTGKWTRHSLVYDSEPGDAGFTELRLYPAYGSSTATRIAVDDVEVYRVACVTDRVRSNPVSVEFEDEAYYECDSPYGVNLQDVDHASRRRINESEARGLSAAIEPEGKFSAQNSTRAVLEGHAADAESAAGLGAPVALYYSRRRPVLTIDVEGLERIPLVGDYSFHRDNPRIPESADSYPIWRISSVETSDASGKYLRLQMRHQIDPVEDRIDIAPDNIPMGASCPTLSPAAITDYAEITSLQNQFLCGARRPDVSTQRGSLTHKHPLVHTHGLAAHAHTITPSSHGVDGAGAASKSWPVEYVGTYGYPGVINPQTPQPSSRGLTDGGHTHDLPGSGASSGSSSGSSSEPNSTLETPPGPNEPSYLLCRLMQRVANTVDTIDANLIVGFPSLPLPAGWTRVKRLDGMHLKCSGTLGAMSTTTSTTFTPTDAGSTLPLSSGTGAILGRRLTVTKSGSTVHVIVTVENGANPTVVPLHETSDVANGSFPSGSGATVTADSQLLVRTNVATSTYTPNDAGSTLKVASAGNIGVGSLLTVINTDDADKYVHVRVTAVSGTDLTVVPLHLPGDQANSYNFTAGAGKIVVHSEFAAPTHKHGGSIASHQHAVGNHTHSAATFYLANAANSLNAQKLNIDPYGAVPAAVAAHGHYVGVPLPADNTASSSAGGTITGDLAPVLPFIEIIWATSDGTQRTIPATGILCWTQSNDAPDGYARIGEAKDLFLKGAAAGAAGTSGTGGHVHQQADDAHTTMTHGHGGTVIVPTDSPDGSELIEERAGATRAIAAGSSGGTDGGHAHQFTVSVASVNPTGGLLANSAHDTGAASGDLPYHKTVMLIAKG